MRMFSTCINVQFAIHLFTQFVFREHAANCHFYNAFRMCFEHMAGLSEFCSTGITGMMEIGFLDHFLTS